MKCFQAAPLLSYRILILEHKKRGACLLFNSFHVVPIKTTRACPEGSWILKTGCCKGKSFLYLAVQVQKIGFILKLKEDMMSSFRVFTKSLFGFHSE